MATAALPLVDTAQPASVRSLLEHCNELAHTDPGDIHAIASVLQEMMIDYYADVRKQAQQSFRAALIAAGIGTAFFIYAVWLGMNSGQLSTASTGLIAGGLIQVISGINFYLYSRAARQFGAFHICLERTNRFILANTLCEKLHGAAQDDMRKELILTVARAPMLTMDVIVGKEASPRSVTASPPAARSDASGG